MKEFSFCESVLASSRSTWHIRRLTDVGRRLTGGIDTPSLCGRVKPQGLNGFGGWDLQTGPEPILTYVERGIACAACAEAYNKEKEQGQ